MEHQRDIDHFRNIIEESQDRASASSVLMYYHATVQALRDGRIDATDSAILREMLIAARRALGQRGEVPRI